MPGLLYGGVAASAANPFFVTGAMGVLIGGVAASPANPVPVTSSAGMGTNSGTLPGVSVLQSFKDPGGLNQAFTGNNAGAVYVAIKGDQGTRNVTSAYRAVVGPLTGTAGSMANIVNPNTGSVTVYLKEATLTAVLGAGTLNAQNLPTMVYGGMSNATLTGTTVASVALSQSYAANSVAVVTSAGSNNAVTNKLCATLLPTLFVSGSTSVCPPYTVNLLNQLGVKDACDLAIAPGHAFTIANSGLGQASYFYVITFSWEEGGPV